MKLNKLAINIAIFILPLMMVWGCQEVYTPKPKAYPRIVFPELAYEVYESETCPFQFEKPAYTIVERDSLFFNRQPDHPCWFDVSYPMFNSKVHFSYKEVTGNKSLQKMLDDTHKLTFKHTAKAEAIDEIIVNTPNNVNGLLYDVAGNAASNFQFYVTDNENHFLRGAVYFRSSPNIDSIGPVLQFIRDDMLHMLETLQWEEE